MALNVLGPDYRFETSVWATGDLNGGILSGDLFLVGGADPLLDAGDLMGLVNQLREQGISSVTGGFYFDTGFIPSFPVINPSQPLDAAYNPGLSALSFLFNRAKVRSRPNWPAASIVPETARRQWGDEVKRLPHRKIDLPIQDPARVAAETFRQFAKQAGLRLSAPAPKETPKTARIIAIHQSAPLWDVVRDSLEYSNNMTAELIGLTTVRAATGKPTTLQQSGQAMQAWFASQVPELNWSEAFWPNHSGLSSQAKVTPRQMLEVLRLGGTELWSRLPAAGFGGGQSAEWSHPSLAGRLWAKSGTLRYARGVVGRLYTESGRNLLIALYIQNPTLRKAYDQVPQSARTPSAADRKGDIWINAARAKEARLLTDWVTRY